jgi:hypothetical protein
MIYRTFTLNNTSTDAYFFAKNVIEVKCIMKHDMGQLIVFHENYALVKRHFHLDVNH